MAKSSGAVLHLTLNRLHIHFDAVSPLDNRRQWCNVMISRAYVCMCIHSRLLFDTSLKTHLDLTKRAMTFSGLALMLEAFEDRYEDWQWEIEREKRLHRLTESERKTSSETVRKRGDGMIDLSTVLLTWLIFVFHCFSPTVIWVKVIWVGVRLKMRG